MKAIRVLLTLICVAISARAISGDDKHFEECRAKLIKAQKLDLLYNMDWKKGTEPLVVVGPTFYRIPFDAKESFAETLNCFFMGGDTNKYISFNLRDWRTNKKVARYSYGKLKVE